MHEAQAAALAVIATQDQLDALASAQAAYDAAVAAYANALASDVDPESSSTPPDPLPVVISAYYWADDKISIDWNGAVVCVTVLAVGTVLSGDVFHAGAWVDYLGTIVGAGIPAPEAPPEVDAPVTPPVDPFGPVDDSSIFGS